LIDNCIFMMTNPSF